MTRINTNVSSLTAQTRLQRTNNDLQTALTRLSTGLRINSGKDDPAGLIASESLRSDITSINKALSNTQRASQIIGTADSALGQVSSLLNDIRGLVTEAANKGALSDDEIAANQLQVDSSLEAINRIAQTTTFQGRKLLDGSLDFITKAGTGFGTVSDLKIDQANLGATGNISVNVSISSAATRATISNSGVPASSTVAAKSTGTITFGTAGSVVDAVVDVGLANSYTVGAEATKAVSLAGAYVPNAEASTVAGAPITLASSGINFDITAVNNGLADGTKGNNTTVQVAFGSGAAGTGSAVYDANTDILTLNVKAGDSHTDIAGYINTQGTFAASNAAAGSSTVVAGDAGAFTGRFTAGTDTVAAGTFSLTAVNGGAADGAKGNATTLEFTSGGSNGAVYNSTLNKITVTVAAGATIADISNTINTDLSGDFIASNTTNGTYKYATSANGVNAGVFSGGTNPAAVSNFRLQATSGGDAGGTLGNSTQIVFSTGGSTAATYDVATNKLNVTVADGATVNQVAAAINTDGTFQLVPGQTLNGTALFSATDFGTNTPTSVTTGTDLDGVITVEAKTSSAAFDKTITVTQSNSIAAGAASASVDSNGNIIVNVRNAGTVNLSTIRDAINTLDDYTATLTTGNGNGIYDIDNESAPVVANLTGGSQGGGLIADLVFQLTGGTGSEVFQFQKGASLANIVQSINLVKDATGIQAEDDAGNLKLSSTSYGSKSVVSVEVISEGTNGTFKTGLSSARQTGSDIVASVNGYSATGEGNTLSINTSSLDLSLTVTADSTTSVNFDITGGGALFQLGGDVVSNQQARLGIGSLSTGKLGGPSGRLFELASGQVKSLATDTNGAAEVIDAVITKVTSLRGRLGAFQRTALESNSVSLSDTLANLNEAQSSIRDADFAKESANLTRAQVLVQSGTSVLGIANQSAQNVLALLR
ncbi:MAG: flagellin [Pirellulaceae bacterium]|nr:flagellin [Pirellulaceae bacterium]